MQIPSATEFPRPGAFRSAVGRAVTILRQVWIAGAVGLGAATMIADAQATSRIKDVAAFEGVRDNLLVGYGLVVGLSGSGDTLANSAFTKQSLIGMLERLGVNTRDESLKTANIAAVMVTAVLPPFTRQGSRIDVTVSALGDAKSLLGGTLLVTPLVGAVSRWDRRNFAVYGVADHVHHAARCAE